MSLKARVTEDMKTAMRAKDAQRLSAIRLLLAAIKQREVDERKDMSDPDVISVIEKMIKQRRDSIEQFQKGGARIVDVEQFELAVLQGTCQGTFRCRGRCGNVQPSSRAAQGHCGHGQGNGRA